MKNRAIEYPHPVLNEYTNDFDNCAFNLSVGSHSDTGNSIDIELSYSLTGSGIQSLISQGLAKVFIRVVCFRTSFRKVFEMSNEDITVISLPKKNVTDSIDISAAIVAAQNINNYCLPEFNQDYFGGYPGFKLRKGDIIVLLNRKFILHQLKKPILRLLTTLQFHYLILNIKTTQN